MKKIYGLLIFLYLGIAVVLIILAPKRKTTIQIAVKEGVYSQVLTDADERFEILIYMTENDSFLTTKSAIIDARLMSEESEMAMTIDTIDNLDRVVDYQNQVYHVFRYVFDLSEFAIDTLKMDFSHATLQMTYENNAVIELEMGEVHLLWDFMTEETDFDFFRLSGLYGIHQEKNVLEGIMIGFDRFIQEEIIIHSISCGINVVHFNLDHALFYDEIGDDSSLYETLEPNFNPFDNTVMNDAYSWEVIPSKLYAIPLNYQEKFIDLWRFPLIITYEKNQEVKQMVIDDFMFRTETIQLAEELSDVFTYQYRYRD